MSDTCKKCGNNLYGNKTKCPFCGEPIRAGVSPSRSNLNSNNTYSTNNNSGYSNQPRRTSSSYSHDSGGAGWGLLGFCVPIAGIVLYFVWKDEKPYTAKACLNGALISIGLSIFLNVVTACMAAM